MRWWKRSRSGPRARPTPVGDIPRSATNALGDNEFRRVVIRGRFIHACEFHLFTPMRNGAGWAIITAFQREGDAVPRDLIIRGLAPDPVRAPAKRMAGQVDGVVELTGRLRADHLKASFVPPNEPVRNNWYSRDMAAMAAAGCGGMPMTAAAGAPAFFIEYDGVAPSGGWPKPEPDAVQLRNDHLQYAITWFSLAGVLIGMFAYWLSVQRREKAAACAGTGP